MALALAGLAFFVAYGLQAYFGGEGSGAGGARRERPGRSRLGGIRTAGGNLELGCGGGLPSLLLTVPSGFPAAE